MSALCTNPNLAQFSSLIAHWPLPSSSTANASVARFLSSIPHASLLYSSPSQLNEARILSTAATIAHLPPTAVPSFLSDNSTLSPQDLFAVLLRQLNLALLPDWISKLMHVQLFAVIQE